MDLDDGDETPTDIKEDIDIEPSNEISNDVINDDINMNDDDDDDLFGDNDDDDDDLNQVKINDNNDDMDGNNDNELDTGIELTQNSNINDDNDMDMNNDNNNNNENNINKISDELFGDEYDGENIKEVPMYNNKRYVPKGGNEEIEIQYIDAPPIDSKFYILRLPNVITIEPEAFNKDEYMYSNSNNIDDINSTIRWQITSDENTGEKWKMSNTRFVIWSDNSKSLIIGDEVYDIDEQKLVTNNFDAHKNRDYLFADLDNTTRDYEIKMCQGKFHSRFNVKPSGNKAFGKLRQNINQRQKQKFKDKYGKIVSLRQRKNRNLSGQARDELRNQKSYYQQNLSRKGINKMDMDDNFLENGAGMEVYITYINMI